LTVLAWIVLGLVAGAIAKLLMPGDQRGGIILTTLLGIVGALVGGYIGRAMGYVSTEVLSWGSLLWAIVGSFLLLLIGGLLTRKRR
jgi:uncharacterized membrane protein YeaQ/YmgE (transglycosylase-associated protein family)